MRNLYILPLLAVAAMALPSSPALLQVRQSQSTELPLIIWHGLGDTYDSDGMNSIGEFLNETIGDIYTYNVRLDDDAGGDRTATFLGNVTEHIAYVCDALANEPVLNASAGINAIGFSQGGLFLRGFVERCNYPPVKRMATFGSPHSGISQFQDCTDSNLGTFLCAAWEGLLETQTWTDFVQSHLVPAQYYRDPKSLDEYLEHSNWLADINNERAEKNETYKKNLASVEEFWMYQFQDDKVVVPQESEWFDDVVEEDDEKTRVVKLRDRTLYQEDWLGLKQLDERGALQFKSAEGPHMHITDRDLSDVFNMMYRKHEDVKLEM